jgi:hypothetical protein
MTALPADIPVTTPAAFTAATPAALLFHVPPEVASVKVVVPFTHIVVPPPIGLTTGEALTICVIGGELLPEKLRRSSEV